MMSDDPAQDPFFDDVIFPGSIEPNVVEDEQPSPRAVDFSSGDKEVDK